MGLRVKMASIQELTNNEHWSENLRVANKSLTTDTNESFTLRVRGAGEGSNNKSTDPVGLSRSILHVLRKNQEGWVNVQCVGAKSLFIASIAYQMAASEIEKYSKSVRLVNTQWTYATEIAGKPAKGICMRIFAIPELHAR